jgi:hypothetical protein
MTGLIVMMIRRTVKLSFFIGALNIEFKQAMIVSSKKKKASYDRFYHICLLSCAPNGPLMFWFRKEIKSISTVMKIWQN